MSSSDIQRQDSGWSLQVLGLLIVAATATGCLYFLDPDEVASYTGLSAAGILLLIVNLGFVVLMAALISKRGRPAALKWLARLQDTSSRMAKKLKGLLHLPWGKHASVSQYSYEVSGASASSSSSVQLGLLPLTSKRSNTSTHSDVGLAVSQSGVRGS